MKRTTKKLCLLLTACLLAGICAACAPTASPGGAAPAESPAQSQTQPGGDAAAVRDTLVVVNNSEVQSCDPLSLIHI